MFSAEIEDRDGRLVVTVPEREVDADTLAVGGTYRVAILPHPGAEDADSAEPSGESSTGGPPGESWRTPGPSPPPVATGDRREVEIEDVGDQGDGIARVGPGYVVFVPGAGVGDRLTVEITRAEENFAFATVVEDEPIGG